MKTHSLCSLIVFIMVTRSLLAAAGPDSSTNPEAVTHTDTFESYAPDSDGSPNWRTASAFWEVRDGAFFDSDHNREFAILDKVPAGSVVSVQASVTVERPLIDDWKIAGVAIYRSPTAFWHLALVEQPTNLGQGHFLELSEMLDSKWNAQSAPATKLTSTSDGRTLNWQTGQTYRLTLALSTTNILGTVTTEDGTEVARLGYKFDHTNAVTAGRAALDNCGFLSRFDNVAVSVTQPVRLGEESAAPAVPPKFVVPTIPEVKGSATGFFRLEESTGKSWLIAPNGQGFFITGVDHVNYNAGWCEKLGYSPYQRNVEAAFGSEERWAKDSAARLTQWGFNTAGAGHSESIRHRGLAHAEFLQFGSDFSAYDDIVPKVHWTGLPNVFSPKFRRFCERRAAQLCATQRDDPWLIGYFLDNELEWYGKNDSEQGVLDETMKKPADHTARLALMTLFKKRHTTIASFNQAWTTQFAGWSELESRLSPLPPAPTPDAKADATAYLALCTDTYFSVTTAAVRKADPNHLILGCRFAGRAADCLWEAAGRYCDIVTVNIYPRADMNSALILEAESNLRRWHTLARKPMAITEWSFPSLDSGLPCQHGAGMRVDTQLQRTLCSAVMQDLLARIPFVVGSFYFMWADEPALGISSTFPEDSNYGLVNEKNEPYPLLTGMFAGVNPAIPKLHAGTSPRAGAIGELQAQFTRTAQQAPAVQATNIVTFSGTTGNYSIVNGPLRLTKTLRGGNIFDRIELHGVPVGTFNQLIMQKIPQNTWVAPDRIESIKEGRAKDGTLLLEIVGVKADSTGSPGFRACYQLAIPAGTRWFASRFLWLENISATEWTAAAYYHYTPSAIGGDKAGDIPGSLAVPNYWLSIGAWYDPAISVYYGAVAEPASGAWIGFWIDDKAGQHPDAKGDLDTVLAPGQRIAPIQPFTFVFAAEGSKEDRPWTEVISEARAWKIRAGF